MTTHGERESDGAAAVSRRGLLRAGTIGAAAAWGSGTVGATAAAAAPSADAAPGRGAGADVEIVALGTAAGPPLATGRAGISTVLRVHGRNYVVDCGRSAVTQYNRAGLLLSDLAAVLITHLHADHLADYYNFFLLGGWGDGDREGDGISQRVPVYGPGPAGALPPAFGGGEVPTVAPDHPTPGLADLTHLSIEAHAYSTNVFLRDSGIPDVRELIDVHEIEVPDVGADPLGETAPAMDPFVVAEDDRVRVSAILVPHGPVFPSFAFRFDTDDGSIVFSGDTARSDNVVRLASGADVLVHEAIDLDFYHGAGMSEAVLSHLEKSHTTTEDVGRVAQAAGVGTLVLSHLAPGAEGTVPDGRWVSRARRHFDGRVVRAHELTRIPVRRRAAR
ncbi:MBL fold metallo-hydrolase [Isoptericola sp. BMS4]|uniref:MBL fold metallo-hydrolase n=1 Tax=Isoptericola sp. BMS4 TaxID=2527875 RepID=UPI0014231644|nr:MBL fold metallo-hydrolase [Isoptericola sp. BMS4]